MSIRRATLDDAEHCARLGLKFIEAADMPPATFEQCLDLCTHLVQMPEAGVFVSPIGVIAGVIAPLYYNPAYKQAVELWWWAEDGNGFRLQRAFEAWAIAAGADDVNMSTLDHYTPDGVESWLHHRGYEPRDKTLRKRLK
jgi:hypothetical protein